MYYVYLNLNVNVFFLHLCNISISDLHLRTLFCYKAMKTFFVFNFFSFLNLSHLEKICNTNRIQRRNPEFWKTLIPTSRPWHCQVTISYRFDALSLCISFPFVTNKKSLNAGYLASSPTQTCLGAYKLVNSKVSRNIFYTTQA